jgi:hypothetical protein
MRLIAAVADFADGVCVAGAQTGIATDPPASPCGAEP